MYLNPWWLGGFVLLGAWLLLGRWTVGRGERVLRHCYLEMSDWALEELRDFRSSCKFGTEHWELIEDSEHTEQEWNRLIEKHFAVLRKVGVRLSRDDKLIDP